MTRSLRAKALLHRCVAASSQLVAADTTRWTAYGD